MGAAHRVAVIIPACNEEGSLPRVLESLSCLGLGVTKDDRPIEMAETIVVDNASTDGTAEVASGYDVTVLREPRRGYGRACLRGVAHLKLTNPDSVVFLDADSSDDPSVLPALVRPIADGEQDFVLGSRLLGRCEPRALAPQARYGNTLSVFLIWCLYGFRYTDLGPFRAIGYPALRSLGMSDPTFGWTAEMQVKAILSGLRIREIPVPYRRRIGTSKISGTVSGTVKAGMKILWTIVRLRMPPIIRGRGRS